MSFSVQVTPDLVALEPGATTPVSIVVVNKGTEADRFELEIEGLDPEWKAVPVPVFPVDGSETHSEKVFLKPPRASESMAGNYPFVVRVRSLISGEQRTVQGVAQIKPFHHLSMEIDPKKGSISPTRKHNAFEVTLVNLGNTEHTIQLLASDPEDVCAYEFDQEQVTIGPGQQKRIELIANPTTNPIFSSGRLIGFTVSGRSIDTPAVVSSAQAQLEQRPLLTPTSLTLAVLVFLVLGAWYMMKPKPPTLTSLAINPAQVLVGQPVTITWETEHAKHVLIRAGAQDVYDGPDGKGEKQVTMSTSGVISVHIEVTGAGSKVEENRQITVDVPPVVPLPHIFELKANPLRVKLGQPFLMTYKLSDNVTQALLEPTGENIDKALDRLEITPVRSGDIEYTLVVKNATGDTDRRSFKVNVYDESDAQILDFHPNVKAIKPEDGKVTLTWQVTGAERVEIKAGNAEPTVVTLSGTQDFVMTTKTTFLLTAIDAKNRRATRQVSVSIETPPSPPLDPSGDPGLAPNTGSSTGVTTATVRPEATPNVGGR